MSVNPLSVGPTAKAFDHGFNKTSNAASPMDARKALNEIIKNASKDGIHNLTEKAVIAGGREGVQRAVARGPATPGAAETPGRAEKEKTKDDAKGIGKFNEDHGKAGNH